LPEISPLSCSAKAEVPFRLFRRRFHQLADGFEDDLEFIVLLAEPMFELFELAGQVFVGGQQFAQADARMMAMLTWMARLLRRTLESMATPCSVKANGRYFRCCPRPSFKVTICDLKTSASASLTWNMKSSGNRARFRLTA
jgi:hypothetical protein